MEQVCRTTELFFSPEDEYRKELKRVTKVLHKGLSVDWLETVLQYLPMPCHGLHPRRATSLPEQVWHVTSVLR